MAANKIELLHPRVINTYLRLQNPKWSIELRLVDGAAAGIRDLQNGLFPPGDVHPDQVPVDFTFKTKAGRHFKIQMMPHLVANDCGRVFVMGFWRHSQAHGNEGQNIEAVDKSHDVPLEDYYFAVRYSLSGKRGVVILFRSLHNLIERHCAA